MNNDNILAPLTGNGIAIGWVDAIHGPDGKATSIEITRHEARELVRYWLEEIYHANMEWAALRTASSCRMRSAAYADMRIDCFINAGLITAKEVNTMYEPRKAKVLAAEEQSQARDQWEGEHASKEMSQPPAEHPPQSDSADAAPAEIETSPTD